MAYTDIDKPTDYFDTKLYTGNAGTQSITMDFATNFIWNKQRNGTLDNYLFNSVTGTGKFLKSNSTAVEGTNTGTVTSFNSDGFTLGNASGNNGSGNTMVSWNWKAGTSFTNDASATGIGSIDSAGSVNQDAGFSICSYTGIGSTGTIKHGLNTAPSMIIIKNRSTTNGWEVYHQSIGNTKYLALNVNDAALASASRWNNTSPTSTVFTVNTEGGVNSSGGNLIAYCFADVQGYSKFSSYIGNGNADGTFIYTGFKPAFLIIKRAIGGTNQWNIHDNKRSLFNPADERLYANLNNAENTGGNYGSDFLSNGFKIRTDDNGWNQSGDTYIYMVFAENPFVTSSGVPATAR